MVRADTGADKRSVMRIRCDKRRVEVVLRYHLFDLILDSSLGFGGKVSLLIAVQGFNVCITLLTSCSKEDSWQEVVSTELS